MIRLEFSLRHIVAILSIITAIWLLLKLWPLLLLIAVSLMLAAALFPFVEWLTQRGLSRATAVGTIALNLAAAFIAIGLVVVPAVIDQVQTLAEQLPQIRSDVAQMLAERQAHSLAYQVENVSLVDIFRPDQVANTGRRVVEIVTSVLTVLFLMIYIVLDAQRIERFLYFAVPHKHHHHVRHLLPSLQKTVGGYIRGQAITSLAITVFTFVVLRLLGVPNALSLAVLAGITDVIPLIGGLLAVVPATLAALAVSPTTAILVGIILIAYQEVENRLFMPRVYGATLRLPTVVVFVALLIGAYLAGIIGALLALPVAAAARVVFEYAYDARTGHHLQMSPDEELFGPDDTAPPAPVIATHDTPEGHL